MELVEAVAGPPLAKWRVNAIRRVAPVFGHLPGIDAVVNDSEEYELWTYSSPKVAWFPYFMRDVSFSSVSNGTVSRVEARIGRSILDANSSKE